MTEPIEEYLQSIRDEINCINLHTQERQQKFQNAMENYQKAIQNEVEVVNKNNDYFNQRNELFLDEIEQTYKKFSIKNINLAQNCKKLYKQKIELLKCLLRKDNKQLVQYKTKMSEKLAALEKKLEDQRLGVGKKDTAKEYQIKRQRYEGLKEINEIEQKTSQFEQQIFNEFKYIPDIKKYEKYSIQQDLNQNQDIFLEYIQNKTQQQPQIKNEYFDQQQQLQQQYQIPQIMQQEPELLLNQFQKDPVALQPPQVQFIQQSSLNQMQEQQLYQQQQLAQAAYNNKNYRSSQLQILQDQRFQRDSNNQDALQSEPGMEQGISYEPQASQANMQNKNQLNQRVI